MKCTSKREIYLAKAKLAGNIPTPFRQYNTIGVTGYALPIFPADVSGTRCIIVLGFYGGGLELGEL